MEDAAERIVNLLYDEIGADGERQCVLVRLYKTHRYGGLPADVQDFAQAAHDQELAPDVRCLTLFGTVGDEDAWRSRHRSEGHKAIPLPSVELLHQFPMVARLIHQLGVDPEVVVRPEEHELTPLAQRTYDVFYVADAHSSPYVPAKDFVERYGVKSAVGFGGLLPTGDFYAVVLFTRVPISEAVAQTLKILSLAVRVPLLAFARGPFFEEDARAA
jgi:hypothetical protein